jgi:hypothetical protein
MVRHVESPKREEAPARLDGFAEAEYDIGLGERFFGAGRKGFLKLKQRLVVLVGEG